VTTGSSSFSGCASYLAFRTVTSARKNYQNSFSSSKFTLRHNCASATEDAHQKSPFVFLYLAHLPLQNVKTKQNMVPEVAPYYLGAEPAGYAQLSLAHKLGPAPNHSGGQVGSDGSTSKYPSDMSIGNESRLNFSCSISICHICCCVYGQWLPP